jgi:hypothetical protein
MGSIGVVIQRVYVLVFWFYWVSTGSTGGLTFVRAVLVSTVSVCRSFGGLQSCDGCACVKDHRVVKVSQLASPRLCAVLHGCTAAPHGTQSRPQQCSSHQMWLYFCPCLLSGFG